MAFISSYIYCLFVIHMFLPVSGQICTSINNVKDIVSNTRVTSSCFVLMFTAGPMTCAAQCMLRRKCKSFNFNVDVGECTLFSFNSSSSEHTAKSDSSYLFSDIGSWPQRLVGSCAEHSCHDDTICVQQSQGAFHCITAGCLIPVINNGTISTSNHNTCNAIEVKVGTHLNYTCDSGFTEYGPAICLENGTWTSFGCRLKPSSCLEVLECNNSSVDGEYWIYLREFQDQRVRVYCHGMNTSQPQEFITLEHPNSGYYPNTSNYYCLEESFIAESLRQKAGRTVFSKIRISLEIRNVTEILITIRPKKIIVSVRVISNLSTRPTDRKRDKQHVGTTVFSKIRLSLETLVVNIADKTFASGTAEELGNYGTARDCYTNHFVDKSECGPKGNFSIDLTDTGFILDPSQEWSTSGWRSYMIVTWLSPAAVDLICGGLFGGCNPVGQLQLSVNTKELEEVIANSSTTTIFCG